MRYILDTAEDCLRLNDIDVEIKLMKHQLGMNYLLGTPITAQAGFQNVITNSDLGLLLIAPSSQITLETLASSSILSIRNETFNTLLSSEYNSSFLI